MDHPPRHCNSWDVNKEYPIWNFRKAPHIQNFQIGSSCLFFTKQRHGLFKCLVVIYNLKITFSISPFSSCLSPKPTLLTKDSQSCKKKKFFFGCKDAHCEPIKEGFEFSCSEATQANACLSVMDLSSRSFKFVATAIGFSYESWQVLCGIDVNTSPGF